MSDTLIGVIIGGVLASVVPIISLFQQYGQWKKEKKLMYLQQERERLRELYTNSYKKIIEETVLEKNTPEFLSEILFLLPEKIRMEFMTFRSNAKTIPDDKKVEYLFVLSDQMKKSLDDIDRQIEIILN